MAKGERAFLRERPPLSRPTSLYYKVVGARGKGGKGERDKNKNNDSSL